MQNYEEQISVRESVLNKKENKIQAFLSGSLKFVPVAVQNTKLILKNIWIEHYTSFDSENSPATTHN